MVDEQTDIPVNNPAGELGGNTFETLQNGMNGVRRRLNAQHRRLLVQNYQVYQESRIGLVSGTAAQLEQAYSDWCASEGGTCTVVIWPDGSYSPPRYLITWYNPPNDQLLAEAPGRNSISGLVTEGDGPGDSAFVTNIVVTFTKTYVAQDVTGSSLEVEVDDSIDEVTEGVADELASLGITAVPVSETKAITPPRPPPVSPPQPPSAPPSPPPSAPPSSPPGPRSPPASPPAPPPPPPSPPPPSPPPPFYPPQIPDGDPQAPPPPPVAPPPTPSLPPAPPSPPTSPPPSAPVVITGDPHLRFAHGGEADFRGEDGATYNMLSHTNVSVNALFEASAFLIWGGVKVRGSFVTDAFWTIKSNLTGRTIRVEFSPNQPPTPIVHGLPDSGQRRLQPGGPAASFEDVSVSMSRRGNAEVLGVRTCAWHIEAVARLIWRSTTPGKKQIDLSFAPLRDPLSGTVAVAPHGLIGQSYDGDAVAVDGKQDHYRELWKAQGSGKELTTQAQAEGAIEGEGNDYQVADFFATEFKYSRFAGSAAAPRNVAALSGNKRQLSSHPHWGSASGSVGDDARDEGEAISVANAR